MTTPPFLQLGPPPPRATTTALARLMSVDRAGQDQVILQKLGVAEIKPWLMWHSRMRTRLARMHRHRQRRSVVDDLLTKMYAMNSNGVDSLRASSYAYLRWFRRRRASWVELGNPPYTPPAPAVAITMTADLGLRIGGEVRAVFLDLTANESRPEFNLALLACYSVLGPFAGTQVKPAILVPRHDRLYEIGHPDPATINSVWEALRLYESIWVYHTTQPTLSGSYVPDSIAPGPRPTFNLSGLRLSDV